MDQKKHCILTIFRQWMIFPDFFLSVFSNFLKFSYLGLLGEEKRKKSPKMKNNYIRYTPYVRNLIAYDYDFWYTCVK